MANNEQIELFCSRGDSRPSKAPTGATVMATCTNGNK